MSDGSPPASLRAAEAPLKSDERLAGGALGSLQMSSSPSFHQRRQSSSDTALAHFQNSVVSSRVISMTPLHPLPDKERLTVIEVPDHQQRPVSKSIIEIPRPRLEPVHEVETRTIEQEVEVLGDVVSVPKPFLIENRVIVPRFVDFKVPVVVSQTVRPVFVESAEHVVEVTLKEYVPEIVPVNLFVPKPVDRAVVTGKVVPRKHIAVDVDLAQFNSLVREMNKDATSVLADIDAKAQTQYRKVKQQQEAQLQKLLDLKGSGQCAAATNMLSINGNLVELSNVAQTRDNSFWLDHMLQTAPDGSKPELDETVHIVSPQEIAAA